MKKTVKKTVDPSKKKIPPSEVDWESQLGSLPRSAMKEFIKQHEEECRD